MTMLNDTVETAMDAAKSTVESARTETQHAASTVLGTLKEGVGIAASAVSLLRSLQLNDALGLVGLARRRGPFQSIALFGSGVIVGAGLGILFTPVAGTELQKMLVARLRGTQKKVEKKVDAIEQKLEHKAKDAVEAVERKVNGAADGAERKVDDIAGKVKGAADGVERKVDDLAGKAKDMTDGAERKVDDLAGKAKDAIRSAERKAEDISVKLTDSMAPSRSARPH